MEERNKEINKLRIKAIIYTSNTGFTKKYADILGEELEIPVYEFKEAKQNINKTDEIIYMGWIMAGGIKNYEKARKKYNIKAVCSVGMGRPNEKQYQELIQRYHNKEKLFYLQGGFDKNKLRGIYKFMMSSMEKIIKPKLEEKENKTEEEIEMLEMLDGKKDCVKKENLNEIINWIRNSKK